MENYKIIFENNQFFVENKRTFNNIGRYSLTNKEGYISDMVYGKEYKRFSAWKKAIEKKIGETVDWDSYK